MFINGILETMSVTGTFTEQEAFQTGNCGLQTGTIHSTGKYTEDRNYPLNS